MGGHRMTAVVATRFSGTILVDVKSPDWPEDLGVVRVISAPTDLVLFPHEARELAQSLLEFAVIVEHPKEDA